MTKLINSLKQDLPEICQEFNIEFVDLVGSVSRAEDSTESDIDLIIDFKAPKDHKLSQRYFGFLHKIEDKYGKKVDLLTPSSIESNPYFLETVQEDRLRLYGN